VVAVPADELIYGKLAFGDAMAWAGVSNSTEEKTPHKEDADRRYRIDGDEIELIQV
jgi:hypothetical protein